MTGSQLHHFAVVNPAAEAEETDRYAPHLEPWDVIDTHNDGEWVSSHRSKQDAEMWASHLNEIHFDHWAYARKS